MPSKGLPIVRRVQGVAGAVPKLLFGLLAACIVLTPAQPSNAFCRTTTCDPNTQDCSPPAGEECTDVGMPLYWPNQCVGYNLQQDAAPSIPSDTFSAVTQRAFQSWLSADCGDGQRPGIEVYDLGAIACGATEYNQYAGNANILTFRTETWPYDDSAYTLALTTVTFNIENAQIYDVDIEINAANIRLTTSDEDIQYDLESILAHEIGHYFGLAHSRDKSATMYAQYQRGTVGLRTPELDDEAGICAIYPPDRVGSPCDPTPRRGLKTTCGDGSPPDEGRCAVSAPGLASPTGVPFLAFAVGLILVMAARGRRNHSIQGD